MDPLWFSKVLGFGQSDFMWMLRLNKNIQKIYQKIYKTKNLVTSFDGFSLYVSEKQRSKPWLHIDQNPNNQTSHRIVDLHGFSLDEANSKINELISICYEKGIKTLKIITGKGKRSNKTLDPYVSKDLSILKNSVPEYIRSNNDLMNMIKEIKNYDDIKGNSGYFEIIMKKKL